MSSDLRRNILPISYANAVLNNSYPMSNSSTPNQHQNHNTQTQNHNTQTQSYPPSIDNNTHPLYLHNNDQPGMILISKKLIGTENYASWKRSLQIALSAKNKLVIVTGDYVAPDEASPLYVHWKRVNDMVITWILNTVSDEISNSMNYMDSAYAVWHELSERFSAVSGHKFYETQRDLFKLEQGIDSIEFYFHKLKGFWDELKALEPPIKCTCAAMKDWETQLEKTRLIQFLMGLHSSYTAARGQLLMMSPWSTVNQAFMLLKQEEKQRQIHSSTVSPIALMANVPKSSVSAPSYIPNRFSERPSLPVDECSHCHIKGHTKDHCYKLVGYPLDHPYHPNNKGKKKVFSNRFTKSANAVQVVSSATSSDSSNLSTRMEELQTQLHSIMQSINKGSTSSSNNSSGIPSEQYSLATHLAGPIPDEGIGSW